MITAVSGIKAPAFKGDSSVDVDAIKESSKPNFQEGVDTFNKKMDDLSQGATKVQESAAGMVGAVTATTATVCGGVGMVKKAAADSFDEGTKNFFKKAGAKIANFFKPIDKETTGKAIEKATQEALEKGEEAQQALQEAIKKGTYNVRKWNLKNVGIAGGVLAAVVAGIALIKKSAQKKNEANFNAQVEEAKKLDEIKHQQELREIEQAQEIAAAKAGSAE